MPAAVERGAATPAQVARTVPGGKAQEAFDPGPGWGGPAAPPAWNAPPAAPPPDMELIADHVLRLLDQRVIAERERFGRV